MLAMHSGRLSSSLTLWELTSTALKRRHVFESEVDDYQGSHWHHLHAKPAFSQNL